MLSKYTQAGNWPISGPKQSMLPGATFYSNFDQGGFIGSGTEIMNLTQRTENMILTNMDWTYRANSPNSLQFTNANQGVIDLPAGVCSLNNATAIAISVWIKPKAISSTEVDLFAYVPQNPGPNNLQEAIFTLRGSGITMGSFFRGSTSNLQTGGSEFIITNNQWTMVTCFIKGGDVFGTFPRIYRNATLMEDRGVSVNFTSTQPMRFIFKLASQWEVEWNNLQIWPNSTLINPVTKFAAERAYYGV